jgi:hypothetical protein
VGDDEVYGHEMNLASKLGEDIAGGGEVLLTEAAHARLPVGERQAERLETTVSNLTIGYYRIDVS